MNINYEKNKNVVYKSLNELNRVLKEDKSKGNSSAADAMRQVARGSKKEETIVTCEEEDVETELLCLSDMYAEMDERKTAKVAKFNVRFDDGKESNSIIMDIEK